MASKRDPQERVKFFNRRSLLIGGGQALLFGGLAARMYYLQVLEADRYRMLAEENRINLRLVPPLRGRIFDRFGSLLASNRKNYRAVIVREQTSDVAETLKALRGILHLSEGDVERILKETRRKRAFVPVTLRENLSWREVSRVEINAPELPGISIEAGNTRSYPYGSNMTHILGYVSAVAEKDLTGDPLLELPGFRIGKQGVERVYDMNLRGSSGRSHVEVNALGRVIREVERNEGTPGQDLVLTLDAGLQNFVHQRLIGELSAAAVVMDIWSGDILALASVPGYDPNPFNHGISSKDWQALVKDPYTPLTNKAIAGQYAPGSTFKMMVALAALEAGISPKKKFFCNGLVKLGNARFHCWKKQGHGSMNMHLGIKHSCDVYFYELAKEVGIDRIAAMAKRFGLGASTGIDLPSERSGAIPTKDWKLAVIGERWHRGETLVAAIGQGFVLATPLQLALMAARIANGGRAVKPRLLRGLLAKPDEDTALPAELPSLGIPDNHMAIIHKAMNAVTNELRGTTHRSRIVEEGMEMAGKTGTSQVRRITLAERRAGVTKNKDLPWKRRDHALFVSFAPVQAPRYACAVVVEHGGGGSKAAAPIAHDLLLETQLRDPLGKPGLPVAALPKKSEV
jgi:penicillin-binding protein 2